ncbi:MAG: ISL3 family transposase [Actinobacteria bacterium]|nr:ISL3 family transposase [Actinomycetota bacterium]
MRITTAFNRLLQLDGVSVVEVEIGEGTVTVEVRLRRRKLVCPHCEFSTGARYDTRGVTSSWRHLRLGAFKLVVRAKLRRLACPDHGVRVEGVAFARPGARFTRDFEQLVAWLAVKMDKDALRRLVGIDWDTVGRICDRVVADELDPGRLDGLFDIGVDEISWKKHHNYLTLVVDHDTNKVVWGAQGRDAKTLDGFFDELGDARSGRIRAVSMDMGPAFRKSVTAQGHAPQATICFDPFHVVKVGTDALNTVRRDIWQQLRRLPDPEFAKKFKGARWALLKNPEDLTQTQASTLAAIRRHGGALWRAYQRKEELRAIFAGGLTDDETGALLDRWCARVQRSRLAPFVKAGRTIRKHRDGILAAIRLGLTNARLEGLNQRVRLIMRRAFGFHTASAALALVMLSAGPIDLHLPWDNAA